MPPPGRLRAVPVVGGDQLLIPLPGQPKLPRPRGARRASTTARWSTYSAARPLKCDDCLQAMAASVDAPASRQARRRLVDAERELLLCYGHAAARGDQFSKKRKR